MNADTIKAVVAIDPSLFARQLGLIEVRRPAWLQQAEQATSKLIRTPKHPVAIGEMKKNAASFQGWKAVARGKVESGYNRPLLPGKSFILDFGEHFTGQFIVSLRQFDIPVDAPVRLAFVFGEGPAEMAEVFDPFPGTLTRAWLQDEVMNFDVVPETVRLPRRYAFRYGKITVVSASRHGKFGFSDFQAEAVTSADENRLRPFTPRNADEAALDLVSRRTLREQIWAEASRRGLGRANEVLLIADGAVWIWNLAGDRFPGARQRVDFYHVSEHLWTVARTLHPADEAAARAWVESLLTKLKADESCAVITELEQLRPRLEGAAGAQLAREINYLQTHRERLDYGTAKARGEPLGSGAMESTCRQY